MQSYIVTVHSAGCLWSVFLHLKILKVLKASKSGGAAAPPHPPRTLEVYTENRRNFL